MRTCMYIYVCMYENMYTYLFVCISYREVGDRLCGGINWEEQRNDRRQSSNILYKVLAKMDQIKPQNVQEGPNRNTKPPKDYTTT